MKQQQQQGALRRVDAARLAAVGGGGVDPIPWKNLEIGLEQIELEGFGPIGIDRPPPLPW
jgi:hypothetical protein